MTIKDEDDEDEEVTVDDDDDQDPPEFDDPLEDPVDDFGDGEGEWDEDGEGDEDVDVGEDDDGDEDGKDAPKKMTSRQMALQSGGSNDLLSLPTGGMTLIFCREELLRFIEKRKKSKATTEEQIRRKTALAENRKKRQDAEAARNKVRRFNT